MTGGAVQELLTRFDLVFALLDTTDAARDAMLSRHVLAQHAGEALPFMAGPLHAELPRHICAATY